MKYITLTLLFLSLGCSSIKQGIPKYVVEHVIENNTDIELGYSGARCNQIKNSCSTSNYSEWQQSNGDTACSCQNSN
ncbi:hypothetical protein [Thalassotalea ganghwensis]